MEVAVKPEQCSPLALAYIGDAVYELYIRTHLLTNGVVKMNDLHRSAVNYVKATTQSSMIKSIEDELSEEEQRIVKRGRNAKSGQSPKNTDVLEYRYSTGFECLVGYLHLQGEKKRLQEILEKSMAVVDKGVGNNE